MRQMNALARMVAAVLGSFALAGTPLAAVIQFGNIAPGVGPVDIVIDGVTIAHGLEFASFANRDVSGSVIEVEARARDSGEVIAEATFTLQPINGLLPMLVLTGNGTHQGHELRLYQSLGDAENSLREGSVKQGKSFGEAVLGVHVLAPYADAGGGAPAIPVVECRSIAVPPDSGQTRFVFDVQGTQPGYGALTVQKIQLQHARNECTFRSSLPSGGGVEAMISLEPGSTARFILLGDGESEDIRVIATQDGVVTTVSGPMVPSPSAVIKSRDFWFDAMRPASGASFYVIAGGSRITGTWFAHDTAGNPRWYLVNGQKSEAAAGFEIGISRASRNPLQAVDRVGGGTVEFADCNTATMRMHLAGEPERTINLTRSQPLQCE